jgi:hypothetical protein
MIKDIILRILYNGRGKRTIEAEVIGINGKGIYRNDVIERKTMEQIDFRTNGE